MLAQVLRAPRDCATCERLLCLEQVRKRHAHRDARAARQNMVVVVHHLLPRATINDRLVALDIWTFLALVGSDGKRAELNALDRLIGLRLKILYVNAVELRLFEGLEKIFFKERAGNTAAPECGVIRDVIRDRLIADNVRYRNSASSFEHTVHLCEERFLILRAN